MARNYANCRELFSECAGEDGWSFDCYVERITKILHDSTDANLRLIKILNENDVEKVTSFVQFGEEHSCVKKVHKV